MLGTITSATLFLAATWGTHRQVERYVRDPVAVDPKATMPPQTDLSGREIAEVAKFLSNLR